MEATKACLAEDTRKAIKDVESRVQKAGCPVDDAVEDPQRERKELIQAVNDALQDKATRDHEVHEVQN